MRFQQESFATLWEEAQELFPVHWNEVEDKALSSSLDVDANVYFQLEDAGVLRVMTARENGAIVGYALYVVARSMHHKSMTVAESDAFFLKPECRRGLEGLRFMRAAEKALADEGVGAIVQKVKVAHDCGAIFKRMGYSHAENVWIKAVG